MVNIEKSRNSGKEKKPELQKIWGKSEKEPIKEKIPLPLTPEKVKNFEKELQDKKNQEFIESKKDTTAQLEHLKQNIIEQQKNKSIQIKKPLQVLNNTYTPSISIEGNNGKIYKKDIQTSKDRISQDIKNLPDRIPERIKNS